MEVEFLFWTRASGRGDENLEGLAGQRGGGAGGSSPSRQVQRSRGSRRVFGTSGTGRHGALNSEWTDVQLQHNGGDEASAGTNRLTKVESAVPAGSSTAKFKARQGRRAPPFGATLLQEERGPTAWLRSRGSRTISGRASAGRGGDGNGAVVPWDRPAVSPRRRGPFRTDHRTLRRPHRPKRRPSRPRGGRGRRLPRVCARLPPFRRRVSPRSVGTFAASSGPSRADRFRRRWRIRLPWPTSPPPCGRPPPDFRPPPAPPHLCPRFPPSASGPCRQTATESSSCERRGRPGTSESSALAQAFSRRTNRSGGCRDSSTRKSAYATCVMTPVIFASRGSSDPGRSWPEQFAGDGGFHLPPVNC